MHPCHDSIGREAKCGGVVDPDLDFENIDERVRYKQRRLAPRKDREKVKHKRIGYGDLIPACEW